MTWSRNSIPKSLARNDQLMQPDDFWNVVAEGTLVDAKGTETAVTTLLAEELDLENWVKRGTEQGVRYPISKSGEE